MYRIEKVTLTKSIMNELIDLSKLWKEEAISLGITPNTKKDFVGKDIYVSYNSKNKIIGYLLCSYFIENKEKPMKRKWGLNIKMLLQSLERKKYQQKKKRK